jgi:[protein-PII] uridylyltransferase
MPRATSHVLEDARREFFENGLAGPVLTRRTAEVNQIILHQYESLLAPTFLSGLALVAVGGYGRGELFPHSDVDLLILVDREPATREARDALSGFLRAVWDSGLRLSHSVRTPGDVSEIHQQNIELNISLLDQRYLAGDMDLYGRLAERLPRFLHSQRHELARHLCRLARSRHAKYQNTIYHLEPNLKETPGGLRDLHSIWWLSKLLAQPGAAPAPAVPPEWEVELDAARQFIHSLRCYLHYQAGRDQNLLSFDAQEEITDQPFAPVRDPAAWMREYFRHARAVWRAASRWIELGEGPGGGLLASFRDWRSRLSNADFTVARERVYFKAPHQLDTDPELAIRLFQFLARHDLRMAPDTERRIVERLPALAAWYSEARSVWRPLRELLSLPGASEALHAMHECGLVAALFPEWKRVECLVVRDFYHRYTVDEHSLIAIRSLGELQATKDLQRTRFAALLSELEHPSLLRFALLFHDVGKGSGGDHVTESLKLAHGAMQRIGVPDEDRDIIEFLIENHLLLSSIMNARDLEDPGTAVLIAERAGTVERLGYLTLMTYADITAVNPSAMTSWRLDQLWRAYRAGRDELTRELDTERIETPPPEIPHLAPFVRGFPTRYLRTHSQAEIEQHFELEQRSRAMGVALDLVRHNATYRLTLVATDRPFLFASIAGTLASFGLNILKAEAFSNREGRILDTFCFSDPGRTLELNPSEVDRFRVTVERVVLGRIDVKQLLQNRPRPQLSRGAQVRPSVTFDSEASESATLIEITAEDRPGLLYDLASTISMSGCNIEVVLIDTEAHRALDVFYITRSGSKLTADQQDALRMTLLAAC